MNVRVSHLQLASWWILASVVGSLASAQALIGPEFSYQGQLRDSGVVVCDSADLRFTLFDAESNGAAVSSTLAYSGVAVENGLFSVALDFGVDVFNGSATWLEVEVRTPSGSGSYTVLSPRQPVWAVPYSLQTRGLYVTGGGDVGVGVGASNPAGKLEVRSAQNRRFVFTHDSVAGILEVLNDNGSPRALRISPGANVLFGTGGGFVGIGGAPTESLYVVGNICATGTIGACSDSRFKKDVRQIDDSLDLVTKLRGVRFQWDRDSFGERGFGDGEQVGMIAQDVLEVVPELVSEASDGYYSVDYARITPILVEAVKDLSATVDKQSERISRLEKEVADRGAALDAATRARIEGLELRLSELSSLLAEADR